jgi:hypothetical protein
MRLYCGELCFVIHFKYTGHKSISPKGGAPFRLAHEKSTEAKKDATIQDRQNARNKDEPKNHREKQNEHGNRKTLLRIRLYGGSSSRYYAEAFGNQSRKDGWIRIGFLF